MKGTAATSVLPSATFCIELVSVCESSTWKSAMPAAAASSPSVVVEV